MDRLAASSTEKRRSRLEWVIAAGLPLTKYNALYLLVRERQGMRIRMIPIQNIPDLASFQGNARFIPSVTAEHQQLQEARLEFRSLPF